MSSLTRPLIVIEPLGVYAEGAISIALDIPLATIAQARREGKLSVARVGRQRLITGTSILAWLNSSAQVAEKEAEHVA
jgi:hypothetical protein